MLRERGWGRGEPLTGAYARPPSQVLDAFTIPPNGSAWVSPWLQDPIGGGVPRLLSFGWSATDGLIHRSTSGCFRAADPGSAAAPSSAGFVKSIAAPFSWWIEAETSVDVPVIAMWGDSLTCGVGNDVPIHDSPLSSYCREVGALPVHYAYPGTGMKLWVREDAYVWKRWSAMDSPDRVIHFMGRNDISPGVTAKELASRFAATIDHLRATVSPVVHVASLTARSQDATNERLARYAHNAWLRTLPLDVHGFIDFAGAVRQEQDPGALVDEFAADSVHFTTRGSRALAGSLVESLPATTPGSTQRPWDD